MIFTVIIEVIINIKSLYQRRSAVKEDTTEFRTHYSCTSLIIDTVKINIDEQRTYLYDNKKADQSSYCGQ